MTQVKEWSNAELNRKLAELMGYTVYHYDKDVAERCYYQLMDPEFDPVLTGTRDDWYNGQRETEDEAWLDVPDFCSVPAASLEVQAAALKFNTVEYVRNLAISTWREAVDEDEVLEWSGVGMDHIGDLLDATPRERAEAAYITLSNKQ